MASLTEAKRKFVDYWVVWAESADAAQIFNEMEAVRRGHKYALELGRPDIARRFEKAAPFIFKEAEGENSEKKEES